jgi:ATP-binding cassette subfamily B protein
LVFLLCLPVVGVIFWVVMGRSLPYFRVAQEKLDRVSAIVREGLAGTRVVRAFVREGHEQQRFEQAAAEQADVSVSAGRLSALLNPLTLLVLDAGIAAILVLGGGRVYAGNLTQGQLVAFVTYMNQALVAVGYVANLVITYTRAGASARRVTEVLNAVPSVRTAADAQAGLPATPACALELRDVSFTYPGGGAPALQHVSLSVPCGARLGIIGGTGSSKSSLVQLISRLYDATEGSVMVGGVDVRDYDLNTLRSSVAVVLQKNLLFSGTIKENLRWGNENATDEELIDACKLAQAHDFVSSFPDGYDTKIEQGGTNVSGGQKQRLCIARALLKHPKILILDDSTSAVDTRTDALIRAGFKQYIPETTKIIIAQRIASVQDADMIIVMENGKIAAKGTHDMLLSTSEIYREVYEQQTRGGEDNE